MNQLQLIPALPRARAARSLGRDRLLTGVGTAIDSAIMRGVQAIVERALLPTQVEVEALRASADSLAAAHLRDDPRRFFAFADEHVLPTADRAGRSRRIDGGRIVRRELGSAYRAFTLPGSAPDHDISNRDPIRLEHWQHTARPARGTVIALHGFAMGRPAIDAVALFGRDWFERGLDVVLLTLPHHGARKPADARFSGECFAVPHVGRLAEAVREAIWEILVVRNWVRAGSEAPVGLLGLSLGGYLTSLAIGLSDDFDFAVPMVPPACMGDLAWRVFRSTRHGRAGVTLDEATLRESFRVHSPLAHPLRIPKERILIVAGRGDRIVPPEHPTALWEHWGEPAIHWYAGGHATPFGRARVVRAVTRHLESLAIL